MRIRGKMRHLRDMMPPGVVPEWFQSFMKPGFVIAALMGLTSVLALKANPDARNPSQAATMQYKMVTVDGGTWCDPRRQAEVKASIDQIAAAGFNSISIGTYKFMPMYFVDYSKSKYPEAQEYDSRTVARNVSTLRENIRYAKSKGIKWFISRSYSHYAPYNFWKAHQAELNPGGIFDTLLVKAHQSDIYENTLAGRDNIVPQQQWTNPLFRDFFLYSTVKTLEALPELDGFLNAYAEAAWTYDTNKLKENRWDNWKTVVDYKATEDCFVDYADSLYQMLKEKRGNRLFFGLRDWYVTPEMMKRLHIPSTQLVIAVKYAGFDQPLVNYPPWGKSLLDDGYSVILDIHEFDAEHPHPIYWYDHDIITQTFSNIIAAGFTGVSYLGFVGRGAEANDPIRLLTDKAVAAAMKGRDVTDAEAIQFLKPYYGGGANDLLLSLKKVSLAQAGLIKLCPAWFWQGDGLTPGGPQTLKFWMLVDHPDAPLGMAFVRQDVVGVKEYAGKVLAGEAALEKAQEAWKRENKKTPYDVMNLMLKSADEAVAAMLDARKKAPAQAPFLRDIVASAVIHKEMVLRNVAFLKAGLAYYESGGQYDGRYNFTAQMEDTGADKRDECVKEMSALIGHDLILKELCLNYAPRRPRTREQPGYAYAKKIAAILGKQLDIPVINTNELKAMEEIITNGNDGKRERWQTNRHEEERPAKHG